MCRRHRDPARKESEGIVIDLLEFTAIGALLICAIPTLCFVVAEVRNRSAWDPIPGPRVRIERGGYRSATVDGTPHPGHAPAVVKFAAWSCFALGQLFLPLLLMAVCAVFFYGFGLLLIPWLILAVRRFDVGFRLLRRDLEAAARAHRAAKLALILNVPVAAIATSVGLAIALSEPFRPEPLAALAAYAGVPLVSVAQAVLMRSAARALERAARPIAEHVLA
jgi:hypothetical protein